MPTLTFTYLMILTTLVSIEFTPNDTNLIQYSMKHIVDDCHTAGTSRPFSRPGQYFGEKKTFDSIAHNHRSLQNSYYCCFCGSSPVAVKYRHNNVIFQMGRTVQSSIIAFVHGLCHSRVNCDLTIRIKHSSIDCNLRQLANADKYKFVRGVQTGAVFVAHWSDGLSLGCCLQTGALFTES